MRRLTNLEKALAGLLVIAVVVGGSYAVITIGSPQKPAKSEPVSMILSFIPAGMWSPFYYGLDKGFYADEGLAFTIIPGKGSLFGVTQVDQKNVDFATIDAPTALLQVAKGARVKMLMAYEEKHQASIACNFPIKSPKDLEGRNYGTNAFSASRVLVPLIMRQNGADPSKMKEVLVDATVLNAGLFQGKYECTDAYVGDGWVRISMQAEKEGSKFYNMPLYNWGLSALSKVLITRADFVEQKPDVVKRFVRATLKSIDEAIKNPDAAAASVIKLEPSLPPDQTLREWKDMITIMGPQHRISEEKFKATLDLVQNGYNTQIPLKPEELYTNDFLTK